jgi:hypothetical protein
MEREISLSTLTVGVIRCRKQTRLFVGHPSLSRKELQLSLCNLPLLMYHVSLWYHGKFFYETCLQASGSEHVPHRTTVPKPSFPRSSQRHPSPTILLDLALLPCPNQLVPDLISMREVSQKAKYLQSGLRRSKSGQEALPAVLRRARHTTDGPMRT